MLDWPAGCDLAVQAVCAGSRLIRRQLTYRVEEIRSNYGMLLDAKGMGLFICSLITFEFLAGLGTLVSKRGCCLDCQSSTSWLAQFNLSRLMFKMLGEPRLQEIKEKGFEEGPCWISLLLTCFIPCSGTRRRTAKRHFWDKSQRPRCCLWRGWLPSFSVTFIGSPWVQLPAKDIFKHLETCLGPCCPSWLITW